MFFDRLKNNYISLSPLQNLFKYRFYDINKEIQKLFKNGYIPTKEDKIFLNTEYKIELVNYLKPKRESILRFLSLIIMKTRLDNNLIYLKQFSSCERILMAILSIKEKKVIGYNYSLIQVANHFYEPIGNNKQYANIILEGIKEYYGLDEFLKVVDINGTFKKKILEFEQSNHEKSVEYNELIKKVFPKLKI